MPQAYYKHEVGERVLVSISNVNHPTGWWEAVVEAVEDKGLTWNSGQRRNIPWYDVRCKFDDPRLLLEGDTARYQGTVVTAHATVHPLSVRWLFEAQDRARHDALAAARAARIRETALLDALKALGAGEFPVLVARLEAAVARLTAAP